jgi:hypothetical protein
MKLIIQKMIGLDNLKIKVGCVGKIINMDV